MMVAARHFQNHKLHKKLMKIKTWTNIYESVTEMEDLNPPDVPQLRFTCTIQNLITS